MEDALCSGINNPQSYIGLAEINDCPDLRLVYQKGIDAYNVGTSYQWCPEIRTSVEERVWQLGWDSVHIGDGCSIAGFHGTPLKGAHND